MKDTAYYEDLLKRLTKYHNAKLISNAAGLYFKFKCGNEIVAWDKLNKFGHPDFDGKLVRNEKMLLDRYIKNKLFLRETGTSSYWTPSYWSEDFSMFGSRMIKASSYAEIDLKLAMRGF